MGRSHKVWIEATGGSSKGFGIGQDSQITLPVYIGTSATHSKLLSTIKIRVDEYGDKIAFSISLDGQTYRTDTFDRKSKEYSGTEGKVIDGSIEHAEKLEKENQDSFMKTVGLIAKMGEIFSDSKKESNDWKTRMIKAGLGNKGLNMPEDWDELSEEEKETRLNNAIDAITEYALTLTKIPFLPVCIRMVQTVTDILWKLQKLVFGRSLETSNPQVFP